MPENRSIAELWPEGLGDLDFYLVVGKEQIRFAELAAKLKPHATVRTSDRRITATLVGPESEKPIHGHLRVRVDDDDDTADVDFRVVLGPTSMRERSLRITEFPTILAQHLDDEGLAGEISVIASMTLESKRWQPTVPLPITLPGVLDSAAGSPEVTGFEFGFREESSRIKRARVSVFSESEELALTLFIMLPYSPAETLVERGFAAVAEYAKLLVKPLGLAHSTPPHD